MDSESAMGTMRIPKIKNYNAASQQITAEQLMREVPAYKTEEYRAPSSIHIMDQDELKDYKFNKRREFEEKLRMQRHHMGTWIKYAEWEASITEYARARSVFERAMEIDYQQVTLWLKYAEMEMKNKNVMHARNVWDRACKHLPRVDQFWFKYAYMEEMLGNFDKARDIFEQWMTWEPKENAWDSYLQFEERRNDNERCREILLRYTEVFPNTDSFLKAAKFEEKLREYGAARAVYERAMAELGKEALEENFLIRFTKFEIKCKQFERAKILFKYALEKLPQEKQKRIHNFYLDFQKQYGTREDLEDLVLSKRRTFIEEELTKDSYNYDLWFDYARLEEQANTIELETIRDVYERAIANQPLVLDKVHWKRYVYLWINYAVFEEDIAKDMSRAAQVFEQAIKVIPHESSFTFSKVWIAYAQFLIRRLDLAGARKLLG